MMYDHEKSDLAIVAVKPTNKAGQPAAELVEPRAGNASQQSTGRAQYRGTVSQALKRMRNFVRISRRAVTHPRWEKLWGGRRRLWHLHRPYKPMEVAPVAQVNDLSRSLNAFDPISTLVVVVEMSKASWLVSGVVPGVERQPLKKLEPDATVLLRLIERWRNEALRSQVRIGAGIAIRRGQVAR
jgi:hypothetical protein